MHDTHRFHIFSQYCYANYTYTNYIQLHMRELHAPNRGDHSTPRRDLQGLITPEGPAHRRPYLTASI